MLCFLLQTAASRGEEATVGSSRQRRRHRPLESLPPLVLLFGRVWRRRRLLPLKAAPEEGERRVHHVVSALGGGDVVPFVWKNLDGRKWGGKTAGFRLGSSTIELIPTFTSVQLCVFSTSFLLTSSFWNIFVFRLFLNSMRRNSNVPPQFAHK